LDVDLLEDIGVKRVFSSGSQLDEIAAWLRGELTDD
jgi:hypothetical protein